MRKSVFTRAVMSLFYNMPSLSFNFFLGRSEEKANKYSGPG
jgi:hypothetical protein